MTRRIASLTEAQVFGRRASGREPASASWTTELRATAALSGPLIATSIAQMAINAISMAMVGRLGAGELAATALANGIYTSFLVFSLGLVSAVAPMLANERGRHRHAVREMRRTVRQGFWAALAIALPIWLILWQIEPLLVLLGQEPGTSRRAALFMHYQQWGLLPQLFYMVLRSFLSVLERPLWTLLAASAAILVNLGLGACLIFGRLGAPALGLAGAGIANACAGAALFLGLACVVRLDRRFRRYRLFGRFWRHDWPRLSELMRLGWPIAITIAFEATIFSAAVIMMGLIGTTAVAAHAIALQIATLGYMVPTGIAQATTVRVGLARGAGDAEWVKRAGWTGYWLALGASSLVALLVVTAPQLLAGIFIDLHDPANGPAIGLAMSYLGFAALFLMADSMQVIAAGMLRGLHDTRVPMLIAAIGYWVIGLPLGALLAFRIGVGGVGIWIGLAAGLGAVGVLMTARWAMRQRLGLLRGIG
ncbi:MAG: MATE family efflux transporter [Hyphomicrobiales bacterium]